MTTPPQDQNPNAPVPVEPTAPQQPYPPHQGAPFQGVPVPPPAPAKRFSKKLLRIGVFIVVAIAIAGGKWYFGQSDAETTSVGACLHNDGTDADADLNEVDCSSDGAQYTVVEKFDNSSDENKCKTVTEATIYYIQSGSGHDVVLCLKEAK
ncbi:LppU/SCO3897 family protein [Streptomyces sp. QTS52]